MSAETLSQIKEIGTADIVIGIPSYNNEKTIGHVIKAAEFGLAKYFPNMKPVLVNSDGGSSDRTREKVKEESGGCTNMDMVMIDNPVAPMANIVTMYSGIPGKGSAVREILEITDSLNAKACMLLDADLRAVTPEWVEMLLRPILRRGYDYVCPLYSRHKYDGTITNMIVYPSTRALYGKRVRQPIGGDFGISGDLVKKYLSKDVWGTDVARFGIDIWMTTVAISEGAKICQAFLGAKIHDPKDPGSSLGPMFKQVVGTVFKLMKDYQDVWEKVDSSSPTANYGFISEVYPEPVKVSFETLIQKFRSGVEENKDFWKTFLPAENLQAVCDISEAKEDVFNFPVELWVQTVYDFAVSFNNASSDPAKEKVIESMTPLYFGRVASFVMETKDMETYDAERVVEAQARVYESMKPYLREKWKA